METDPHEPPFDALSNSFQGLNLGSDGAHPILPPGFLAVEEAVEKEESSGCHEPMLNYSISDDSGFQERSLGLGFHNEASSSLGGGHAWNLGSSWQANSLDFGCHEPMLDYSMSHYSGFQESSRGLGFHNEASSSLGNAHAWNIGSSWQTNSLDFSHEAYLGNQKHSWEFQPGFTPLPSTSSYNYGIGGFDHNGTGENPFMWSATDMFDSWRQLSFNSCAVGRSSRGVVYYSGQEVDLMKQNNFLESSSMGIGYANREVEINGEVHPEVTRVPLYEFEILLLMETMHPWFAMDETISNYLKFILNKGNPVIRQNILCGVLSAVYEIMTNKNGSKVFNKLLDVTNNKEKKMIVKNVIQDKNKLVAVVKDEFGIHCAIKLITSLKRTPPLCNDVVSALSERSLVLMTDLIGSRFIEQCFTHLKHEQSLFFYKVILEHFHRLARNDRGCIVINNCLARSRGPYREQILNEVVDCSIGLARDPFGNYVVNNALDLRDPYITSRICSKIKKDIISLSINKYGSYAVQNCLESSGGEALLQVLIKCCSQELGKLVQDCYGNYVVQTALKVTKNEQLHSALNRALNRLPKKIWYTGGGKHVKNLLQSFNKGNSPEEH